MPIRRENQAFYRSKAWKDARARIMERAKCRCEWCGVPDRARGLRLPDGGFQVLDGMELEVASVEGEKIIQIILTTAHIHNPEPADLRDDNLAALCQRCHNRHDRPYRQANAKQTRVLKRLTMQPCLPGTAPPDDEPRA